MGSECRVLMVRAEPDKPGLEALQMSAKVKGAILNKEEWSIPTSLSTTGLVFVSRVLDTSVCVCVGG